MSIWEIILGIYAVISVLLGCASTYVIYGMFFKGKFRSAIRGNSELAAAIINAKVEYQSKGPISRFLNKIALVIVCFISITIGWPFILVFS